MNQNASARKAQARVVAGLGCLIALVLLGLMSRLPFADYDTAFAQQIPLTLSGDAGCFAGLLLTLFIAYRPPLPASTAGFAAAASFAGLALSLLAKGGAFGDPSVVSLVAGDALAGFFLVPCMLFWWLNVALRPLREALGIMGAALAAGTLLFLIANAAPASMARIAAPLALCALSGACLAPSIPDPRQRALSPAGDSAECEEAPSWLVPLPAIIVLVLSFFVVDFELDLFPIALYFEDMAYGSLPTPGAIGAALLIPFAALLCLGTHRGRVSLSLIYTLGFLLTALGYLLTPYRLQGGFPLAAAEAGRIIVFVFALVVALRLLEKNPTPQRAQLLFAQFGLLIFASMIAADALVMLMQLQEGFDYSDFTFRTLFASCGIAVLVVLLIGPLPRLRELLEAPSAAQAPSKSADAAPATPEERCSRFASHYGLTGRETDVLRLIAAGRDVPYIEQELVLAKSTVKTHVKHIYEKCGVSSRQALLDLIENFES
ncbi:LuxR family transcriptional regulator [uncultured Adlercreutzia sp.]|uniref:helix-turn-helix transcriptional regulator n=1 Tax=uncultured Adlercreutzia sp. TaxID=875803 RepID=UPI0026F382EA|nr:LuxR family transcriptional regulator [uncultured Adlercreutzia sp.]